MMDKIINIWREVEAPKEVEQGMFENENMYELYQLVSRAYFIRREIKLYGFQQPSEKIRNTIMYERAILARLEYSIENLLIKMQR